MSTQLTRLAESLDLLSARLCAEAVADDGTLREKFGGSVTELMALRGLVAERVASNDPRREQLQRMDAALTKLSATFAALPHAKIADLHPLAESRPARRQRRQRALRLDQSTRRLLRRSALVLGLSGTAAALVPLAAAGAGCTGAGAIVCEGAFPGGISLGGSTLSVLVQNMLSNITPASGTDGISVDVTASTGDGADVAHSADGGDTGPDLTLTTASSPYGIYTSGTAAQGIYVNSQGGNGGGGSTGAVGVPARGGGGGGAGGAVAVDNSMLVVTTGDQAAGIWALSRGGTGGNGGDDYIGSGGASGGPGGNAGTVTITNRNTITTSGQQSFGIFGQSIGGNGGQAGGSNGSFNSAGSGGGANKGNTVTIYNYGDIVTTGDDSHGIYGASVGGFGGSGGSAAGLFGYGGSGSTGGDAGAVNITNANAITTSGDRAYGILAQSVGGGGGNGGSGVGIVGLGAGGAAGGAGAAVTVHNTGTIITGGAEARGIFAQSIGGGGGNGGAGAGIAGIGGSGSGTSPGGDVSVTNGGAITTTGANGYAIEAQSIGGGGGDGGLSIGLISIGGGGSAGGNGGIVSVINTGELSTQGDDASAIFAQSIGGGGGNGGNSIAAGAFISFALGGSGGPGGVSNDVSVNSSIGSITTIGDRSGGISAQSIGGGGGNGGFAISASAGPDFSVSVGIGGNGSDASAGSTVHLDNSSAVTTSGGSAIGLFAQSIGGGGGNGGLAVAAALSDGVAGSFAVGGHAGGGGDGDAVTLTNHGTIITSGFQSAGILAQSVGGGGGNGGLAISGAAAVTGTLGFGIGGDGGGGGLGSTVNLANSGNVTTAGNDATAIMAQSIGGGGGNGGGAISGSFAETAAFTVGVGGKGNTGGISSDVVLDNTGIATTTGDNAIGVMAQSIGGGGGNGGFAVAGTLSLGYAAGISVGGAGLGGGNGAGVTLTGNGAVNTSGFGSTGILAQSIGGGGGNGGFSLAGTIAKDSAATFAIGGSSGGGGDAGNVLVNTNANVTTRGDLAYGILAQSLGGGGGTGGFAIAAQGSAGDTIGGVSLALGGNGGPGGTAGTVNLTSGGGIETAGDGAHGVMGQSIGGGGGDGGFAGSFLATIGDGATANFGVGGRGAIGGSGNLVTVLTSGTVITTGEGAYGVLAQSIGGGGGDGGWGMAITGSAASESEGTLVGAIGGNGGTGGLGSAVILTNSANVTTLGSNSFGLLAQSIGGGGGDGGFSASGAFTTGTDSKTLSIGVGGHGGSGNDAGTVTLDNSGRISTTGNAPDLTGVYDDNSLDKKNAVGILAQSIGGGGGNGGGSFSGTIGGADAKTLALNVGGFGGSGGKAGDVTVTNHAGGSIETEGAFGYGIEAQSIGGGGGNGGMALSAIFGVGGEGTNANIGVTLGGEGGDANTGATVLVDNAGGITTRGTQSAAILAQSIGGGGGTGGAAITAIMGVTSVDPSQTKSRTVNVAVAVGGLGGNGSNGGGVTVANSGLLTTWNAQSQGIMAQSIGGGGGAGGNSNTISLEIGAKCTLPGVCSAPDNAGRNFNLQATVGGNGGGASDGGAVSVTNDGAIFTHGELSDGIFAQSIGGGGGNGGNGTLGTGGLLPFPVEVLFLPIGQTPIYQDINVAVGGNSGSQGNGGIVNVANNAAITTGGGNAMAIDAQSVGGGGGTGGIASIGLTGKVGVGGKGGAGGNGGAVTVTSKGALTTSGVASYGILAQSVGGGGGRAGNVNRGLTGLIGSEYGFGIGLAFGQGGGDGGDGGAVSVDNQSAISTSGMGAIGIFAQSVGGGGGQLGDIGNLNVTGLLGGFVGSVGDRGNGGTVSVKQSGDVTTLGGGAAGLFVQSAGGQGTGDAVTVALSGNVTTSGIGSSGLIAQSVGLNGAGNVRITDTGNITTSGDNSVGMLAQSLGAASATSVAGKPSTTVTALDPTGYLLPFLTSNAPAGDITIAQTGTTNTSGANAHGIVAQSISSRSPGGNIAITYNGSINATGQDADGIMAQSQGVFGPLTANGNIAITVSGTGTISGGLGDGAAVRFMYGANNTLLNYGTLTTAKGLDGVTVVGGSGNESFDNFGTLIGEVELGGGVNIFRNHPGATIVPGKVLDLNGSALNNDSIISPGNTGLVLTTDLNGSFNQSASGTYLVDVNLDNLTADRINATGTASLGGAVTLNFDNIQKLRPGTTELTLLSAAGGLTNAGALLTNGSSAVAHYALTYPDGQDAVLTLNVNYAPAGGAINANDAAIGQYFNTIQLAGSSASLAPTIQAVFALPDAASLHNFYQSLSPEPLLAQAQFISLAGSNLTDSMLSCHPQTGGAFRFTDESECSWLRVTPRSTRIQANAAEMGSSTKSDDIALGHQFVLDDNFRLGLAASYTVQDSRVEALAQSHGEGVFGGLVMKALLDPATISVAVAGGENTTHTTRFIATGAKATSTRQDDLVNERLRVSLQAWGDDGFYARPFAEGNFTQLFTGAFHESGAGPLNLVSTGSWHNSGSAGVGVEFGGELDSGSGFVLRPFLGYEYKRSVIGRIQAMTAGFEGAPAGVSSFSVTTASERALHEPSAGFDIITDQNTNVRFLYTGSFGDRTRQDSFSIKLAFAF